ncbi:basic leucine zipper 43-like [Prosopis cineraria]|uniref:basic leucine zipper 43-like n=1 Tax=Prosopis cineraria TaxID=364024 RepID=UPI00240F54B4|nr:basic leucine zipper 43-like [Prosopis cineraria]
MISHSLISQDFNNIFLPHNEIIQNLNVNTLSAATNHHHHHQELVNVVFPSSSTSDEAEEKKQRRMVSNRESARRSRMRKKRHMEVLNWVMIRLRTENQELVQRLKHVLESHDRVLQENAKLKEEASHLRQMLESSSNLQSPP